MMLFGWVWVCTLKHKNDEQTPITHKFQVYPLNMLLSMILLNPKQGHYEISQGPTQYLGEGIKYPQP